MIFDVLTLFPEMFVSPFRESIIGRAIKQDLLQICPHDLRDWASGKHLTVDDSPYGGGDGMVMSDFTIIMMTTMFAGIVRRPSHVRLFSGGPHDLHLPLVTRVTR